MGTFDAASCRSKMNTVCSGHWAGRWVSAERAENRPNCPREPDNGIWLAGVASGKLSKCRIEVYDQIRRNFTNSELYPGRRNFHWTSKKLEEGKAPMPRSDR